MILDLNIYQNFYKITLAKYYQRGDTEVSLKTFLNVILWTISQLLKHNSRPKICRDCWKGFNVLLYCWIADTMTFTGSVPFKMLNEQTFP